MKLLKTVAVGLTRDQLRHSGQWQEQAGVTKEDEEDEQVKPPSQTDR